ncbi:MAG: hypothetical protein ACPL7D_00950 [Candidatus Sumerlaeaceae bacterium]|jgi:hypothetical protein
MLKNLAALASVFVIPLALYLGWNKHYLAAWLLMLAYAAALGYLSFEDRSRR